MEVCLPPPETCVHVSFPLGDEAMTVNSLLPFLGLDTAGCEIGDAIFPVMLPRTRVNLPVLYDLGPFWVPWDKDLTTEKTLCFIFMRSMDLRRLRVPGPDILDALCRLRAYSLRLQEQIHALEGRFNQMRNYVGRIAEALAAQHEDLADDLLSGRPFPAPEH
eukprot:s3147_g22.t1